MRRGWVLALAVVIVWLVGGKILGVLIGGGSDPSGRVGRGRASGASVRVVASDNDFSPEKLDLPAGEEVTVEISNEGGSPHDLAIEALDINTGRVGPGGVAHATFVVPEGRTAFECTYHWGMGGEIVGE